MSDQQTPIIFTGKAGEYFGIWIVNLLLSIVTLGIYSAWAKVRRKKYFYQNTLIDGVAFDYHANPIAILKGRIIAFVLFVLYNVLAGFNPILALVLLVAFMAALPWIITRGMMFNARNSSHRGLRFDFDGKYGQALLIFVLFPILIVLSLGLAMPFVMQRINKFVFEHHKFGTSRFAMAAEVKAFYMIYLKLLGVLLLVGALFSFGSYALMKNQGLKTSANMPAKMQLADQIASTPDTGFIKVADDDAAQAAADAAIAAEESTQMSEEELLNSLTPEERAAYEAEMEAEAQALSEQYQQEIEDSSNPLEKIFGPYGAMLGPIFYVIIFAVVLLYALVIFAISAYVQSRVSNLVWNNSKLDHVGFHSTQRMRDLVWLYFSNIVVLIITFGLATPWAQIRMAKYRLSHLALTGETNWDQFVGEKKQAARATGEEIAEMFDVDISFG
jgi:uncharacterized membrane protein YjgN (DUF898 family)